MVSVFWVVGVAPASHRGNKKKPFVLVFLKLRRAGDREDQTHLLSNFLSTYLLLLVQESQACSGGLESTEFCVQSSFQHLRSCETHARTL